MKNQPQNLEFSVEINSIGGDKEQVDDETRELYGELLEVELASVELANNQMPPEKTKAIDSVLLGTIAISVAPIMITKLLEFLLAWAMRREGRVVKLKMQSKTNSVEIEMPMTMSPDDLKIWIAELNESLSSKKRSR
jgi:hypothetical protein